MKKLLIPFIIFLYLTQIFIILLFAQFFAAGVLAKYFLIAAIICGAVAFGLGAVNIVLGFLQIAKPKADSFVFTMVCKLVSIPFFIINFVLCVMLCAGFLNPMLFMGLFVIIPLMIAFTYAAMFTTSAYNLGEAFGQIKRKEKTRDELLAHMVFQFFFFLDIAGSIMLVVKQKKTDKIS